MMTVKEELEDFNLLSGKTLSHLCLWTKTLRWAQLMLKLCQMLEHLKYVPHFRSEGKRRFQVENM